MVPRYTFRSPTRVSTRLLLAATVALTACFALLAASGCRTSSPLLMRYQEGKPKQFKRRAVNDAVDYLHHWKRKVYNRLEEPLRTADLSPDQQAVVSAFGQPDYVRHPYTTQIGERVHEWAYLRQDQVVQFVGGQLAYSGPLTDYEQVLIQRGYPNYTIEVEEERGKLSQTLIYRNWFGSKTATYYFHGGELVNKVE